MVGSALLARRWRAHIRPRVSVRGFNTWTTTFTRPRSTDESKFQALFGERVASPLGGGGSEGAAAVSSSSSAPKILLASAAAATVLYTGFNLNTGLLSYSLAAADTKYAGAVDWESVNMNDHAVSGALGVLNETKVNSLKTRGFNRSASGGLPQAHKAKLRGRGFYLAVKTSGSGDSAEMSCEMDVCSRRYREARSGDSTSTSTSAEDFSGYVRAWYNPVENRFERLVQPGDEPPSCAALVQYYTRKNRVFDRNAVCHGMGEDCARFFAEEVPAEATSDPLTLFVSTATGQLVEA